MFNFIFLLLISATAEVVGGITTWFFVKIFFRHLKIISLVGILLMLSATLLLIIEALAIIQGVRITLFIVISILAGILSIHLINKKISHGHQTTIDKMGFLVFIAMCVHEFLVGIAFGSSYLISPILGLVTAVFIALQNMPGGAIITIPYFLKKQFTNGLIAVLITQLLYVFGGLIGYYLLVKVSQNFQALTMTFAAGAMLYIIGKEYLLTRYC